MVPRRVLLTNIRAFAWHARSASTRWDNIKSALERWEVQDFDSDNRQSLEEVRDRLIATKIFFENINELAELLEDLSSYMPE
jgi:hypothetical protein